MLKWIKVRQDAVTAIKSEAKNEATAEEGEDSGMEREEPPGLDLDELKKVRGKWFLDFGITRVGYFWGGFELECFVSGL